MRITRTTALGARVALALIASFALFAISVAPSRAEEAGAKIYQRGELPDGSPLEAVLLGGSRIRGKMAACANCHRPSGYGLSEGEVRVPAIAGPILFAPLAERRLDLTPALYQTPLTNIALGAARMPRSRPAYDKETLAKALRAGQDPAGRRLHPGMPRYDLDSAAIDALTAYLDRLGDLDAPGLENSAVNFATVIAGDVAPSRVAAMKAVIDAFVRRHNFNLGVLDARQGRFPYGKDLYAEARRPWRHQYWRLDGPAGSWPEQLAKHYARRPVFALVSGLAQGNWDPIHRFCEAESLPCLFPNSDLPALDSGASWTVYFSRGLALEAEALAVWLAGQAMPGSRTVQFVEPGARAQRFLGSFQEAMSRHVPDVTVDTLSVGAGTSPALPAECPAYAFIWASEENADRILADGRRCRAFTTFIASSGFLGRAAAERLIGLHPRLRLTFPFTLREADYPDLARVRAWLRSRRVPSAHDRLQRQTYFALDAARHALHRIADRFSRAYFLESVEHVAENLTNPALYDSISLGPGQRYAAKGVYLVGLAAAGTSSPFEPLGPRIVP